MIAVLVMFILSIIFLITSFSQFKEKGEPEHTLYNFTLKKQRATMDKKPYYRQSAIVCLLIGIDCFLFGIEFVFSTVILHYVAILVLISTLVYAIASSIYYEIKRSKPS